MFVCVFVCVGKELLKVRGNIRGRACVCVGSICGEYLKI